MLHCSASSYVDDASCSVLDESEYLYTGEAVIINESLGITRLADGNLMNKRDVQVRAYARVIPIVDAPFGTVARVASVG